MEDITDYFVTIIEQNHSIDIAEMEFKRAIAEDEELREEYKNWCHQVGSSEKDGFLDFCHEYMESRNDVWNALSDYDE